MEGQLVFIRALVYIHLNFDILYICKYLYYSAHAQTQKYWVLWMSLHTITRKKKNGCCKGDNSYESTIFNQIRNAQMVFSSPGHRPCELLSWVSVRHPSVSFSHLNLLLWNRWTEISQTCQKCSLDGPLPDLCFWCWFEIQHGCQGP